MSKTQLEEDLRATFERAAASVPHVPDLVSRASGAARQRQRRTWTGVAAAAACTAIIACAGILWQSSDGPATVPGPVAGQRTELTPAASPSRVSVVEDLWGTWRPVTIEGFAGLRQARPVDPVLTFRADGTWSGSDGCNGLRGTFTVTAEGRFTSTALPQRLAGCANVPHGGLLAETAKVAVDRHTLRLLAADGRQVASYARIR